jgi:hypothetical protein
VLKYCLNLLERARRSTLDGDQDVASSNVGAIPIGPWVDPLDSQTLRDHRATIAKLEPQVSAASGHFHQASSTQNLWLNRIESRDARS